MKRKVGTEPEGGSKKRKEVGNNNSLVSMFAKQESVIALNKARDAYRIECTASKKGKESAPRRHNKERKVQGKDVKTSALESNWKTHRPWLELWTVEEGDHQHLVGKSK